MTLTSATTVWVVWEWVGVLVVTTLLSYAMARQHTGLHLIFTSNYRQIKAALTFGTDDVVPMDVLDSEY